MGELEQEYGERVDFVIIPAEETLARSDELEEYGLKEALHGLVIFDADGEAQVKMPGHQFGRPEIEEGLLGVLGAG